MRQLEDYGYLREAKNQPRTLVGEAQIYSTR